MAGFIGQADRSVDSKGRVAIPAKMRSELSPDARETFTVTRGLESCIWLYPQNKWEQVEAHLAEKSAFDRENRAFRRKLLRWAEEVTLDGQGRIVLPRPLQDFAGIDGQALVLGQIDHIEVWNPQEFERYDDELGESYEEIAEQVMGDR